MNEKSTTIAMILSILWTGIGIAYLDNTSKGLGLFAVGLVCSLLARFTLGLFNYIAFFLWIIGIYITYKEIQKIDNSPRGMPNEPPMRRYRRYK